MTNEPEVNDSENVEEEAEETETEESHEETEEETEEEAEEESDEEIETYKTRLEQLEKENKTLKIQKAIQKAKKTAPKANELSNEDVIAIARSKAHDDDIPVIRKYAQFNNLSVREALADDVLQTILEKNEAKRTNASATNMGNSKRSGAKVSDETLVANAKKGILPDESDLDRLISSRLEQRK
jgi:hypothetical protein